MSNRQIAIFRRYLRRLICLSSIASFSVGCASSPFHLGETKQLPTADPMSIYRTSSASAPEMTTSMTSGPLSKAEAAFPVVPVDWNQPSSSSSRSEPFSSPTNGSKPEVQLVAYQSQAQPSEESQTNSPLPSSAYFQSRNSQESSPSTVPQPDVPKPAMRLAAHRNNRAENQASSMNTAYVAGPAQDAIILGSPSEEGSLPVIDETWVGVEAGQVIDLASALGMAGGNAWTIQLARQRTVEAHSEVLQARALWLPTLQMGLGWNKHDGRIQASDGTILEASRNSFFVGGGSTFGSPLAGGSGGPLRLSADLALADAYFASRIAERRLCSERMGITVARNEAVLAAGLAYIDLLEATSRVADAQTALDATNQLLELARAFEEAGAGVAADVDRADAEVARLTRELQNAQRAVRVRSATLARRVRLDPRFALSPADHLLVAIPLCEPTIDLEDHIATALAARPELSQIGNLIAAGCLEVRQAEVDPWVPRVTMVTSAGSFGGGVGSQYTNNGGRSDIDIQAVWQLDSLGLGVQARRQRAQSRVSQDRIRLADLRDEVTAEVVRAFEDVVGYQMQIESANLTMERAESSYRRNLQRIRADEGLPIELLQAIQAKAAGLRERTIAVSQYNRAQLRLLYATGQLLL